MQYHFEMGAVITMVAIDSVGRYMWIVNLPYMLNEFVLIEEAPGFIS